MFHGSSPLLSCQRRRSIGQTTKICSVLTWSRRWKENERKRSKRNKAGKRLKRNADKKKNLRNKALYSKIYKLMQNNMPWCFFLEKLNRFCVRKLQQKKQQRSDRKEKKKIETYAKVHGSRRYRADESYMLASYISTIQHIHITQKTLYNTVLI